MLIRANVNVQSSENTIKEKYLRVGTLYNGAVNMGC